MRRRAPRSTRTGTLFPYPTLFRSHPTVTDPSRAPPGHSTFSAMVPVPHLGKFPVDWDAIGPIVEKRILDEVGRRLIPDIHERIVTKFCYAPKDFAAALNAHLGSAFSLEPTLAQRSEEHTSELQSLMRNSYAVFCLKKKQ